MTAREPEQVHVGTKGHPPQRISGLIAKLPAVPQHADAAALRRIEKLLALQVRLAAISIGLERDRETLADAKQDLAAVCRGDFDEIGPCNDVKAFDLAEDELGCLVGDRVPNPAVDHRDNVSFHSDAPSLARALTRYVAGAVLVPLRQLQRRAWVRRAVVSSPRPSDTTEESA